MPPWVVADFTLMLLPKTGLPRMVGKLTNRWSNRMTDYYATLDVKPSATQREISSAYKTLAKKYHPDKHQDNDLQDLAAEKLRQLNEAYGVLSNTRRRAEYDASYFGRGTGGAMPQKPGGDLTKTIAFWVAVLVALPIVLTH